MRKQVHDRSRMSTAARSQKPADPALTDRARDAARGTGLGRWERSMRINRHHDSVWMVTGMVAAFAAPWPFIGAGTFVPGPWWGKALAVGVGLAVLAFGLLILALVVMQKRTGIGLAHFFEAGLVLERTKGKILAAPYDRVRAELLSWTENTNDSPRARTRLWVTMPQNKVAVIDAGNDAEREDAAWMAQRLGLPPMPRVIEELPHIHAMW